MGSRADDRQHDRADELDRGYGRERQAIDRDVEAGVHQCEDGPECEEQPLRLTVEQTQRVPRSAPDGQDDRCRGDPQPRDAENVDTDEQQDRERRAEVVEDRAPDEVRMRGKGLELRGHGGPA